jgi:polysaccharide export outer membrane protein
MVVPPDGVLSFPLVGDIFVNNMTVADLRRRVKEKIAAFVPDATVTVMLLEINSLKAYVIGKVNNPGVFSVAMNTNIMQILAMAGGLNPYASESKIHILRQKKGKTQKIPFNYKDVIKGKNLEQNIVLKRGDVVVVP